MTDYLVHRYELHDPALSSAFDELSFWSSRFGALLFEHIEIRRDLAILDVGCASGFPLFEMAHTFGNSCRLVGIDIWKEAIERARVKLGLYGLTNVELLEVDAARQPFANTTFDLVVSNLGINNWSAPSEVMAECFRVAKPGGRIVLTTNIEGHYREFYDLFRETLKELGKTGEHQKKLEVQEAHRGNRESITELMEQAGWKLDRVFEDSFRMRFLDGSTMLRHFLVRIGFLDGWRSVLSSDEEPEVFSKLERKLNDTARQQGELRMTVPMLYLEGLKPG